MNIWFLTVECPAFIWLQRHRKWLGDIRDIGDTVSPLGILRLNVLYQCRYSHFLVLTVFFLIFNLEKNYITFF